ncbi:MAG: hypothetical protein MK089_03840 [Phycisphaerales bacterium]|nr:hypothetical protein [Phycisphaerales bacterium]
MNPAMILALTIFLPMVIFTGSLIWVLVDQNSKVAETILITTAILETPIIMFGIFHGMWKPIAMKYPPQDHAPDAITKRCQSFSIGIMNMGWSINTTVDENHLHLSPVKWLQFFGACPMSIPWNALKLQGKNSRRASLAGGPGIQGPEWCFQMLKASTNSSESDGSAT